MQPNRRRILAQVIVSAVYLALICLLANAISENIREAIAFIVVILLLTGMVWFTHHINKPPPSIMRDVDPPRRRKRDR